MTTREILRSIDWVLVGAALLLVLISLAMLFSATYQSGILTTRFTRQAVALGVALAAAFFVVRIPYHVLQRVNLFLYAFGLGGLLVVSASGAIIRGTASRLEFLGAQLQPSEFMKVVLVVTLAWLLARYKHPIWWRVLLESTVIVGLPVALVMMEPDLGVAFLMLCLWGIVLLFRGLPWTWTALLAMLGGVGSWAAWHWLLAGYQKERLLVFLDPASDPLGAGYNVTQSIVAFGSGKILGRGLGHGPQSQLKFLPEQHTDFMLSSIGEELGFIGVLVVFILYAVLLLRILRIARTTRDSFGQMLAVGTFSILLVSLVVSAGMNMGILPVTGIPLPLVSYGGSNLVATFILLAIVESVRVYSRWLSTRPAEITEFT